MLKQSKDANSLKKMELKRSKDKRYLTFFDGKHIEVYDNLLMVTFQPFSSLKFSREELLVW